MSTTDATDMGVGLAMVLGVLAVGGALVTLVSADQIVDAWGFAAAMTLGALAVAAVHLYG